MDDGQESRMGCSSIRPSIAQNTSPRKVSRSEREDSENSESVRELKCRKCGKLGYLGFKRGKWGRWWRKISTSSGVGQICRDEIKEYLGNKEKLSQSRSDIDRFLALQNGKLPEYYRYRSGIENDRLLPTIGGEEMKRKSGLGNRC